MKSEPDQTPHIQTLPVYRAGSFCVVEGVNLDDPVSFADELLLDDIYELAAGSELTPLSLRRITSHRFAVDPSSLTGTPGATLHLDCCLTLMPPTGDTVEALVLVEVDALGMITETYLQPLAPLLDKTPYALVGIDRDEAARRLALMSCVSFTRGTRITRADGAQIAVEDLTIGERILTRDDGAQPIRWIGRSTLRATGPFAPVLIRKGTLNNSHDLMVSHDHRLFVYQRSDTLGTGQAELLVRARHLVNDDSVQLIEGGFVDYVQLLFDRHQIIFAEGIAAETMMVTPETRAVLPQDLDQRFARPMKGLRARAFEVQKASLSRSDAADILRRASSR